MSAATAPASKLWGVGCYQAGAEVVTFPVSEEDLQRDLATARKNLASLGIERGMRVLLTSLLAEAAQYWPVQLGLLMAGAQMSCADASRFDAFRTAMFLRGPRYEAAIGINGPVLDGLEDLALPLGRLLGAVPLVAARADAVPRLEAAGLHPRAWIHVGPTIAVECAGRRGAHVDGDEWDVEADRGEVRITARNPRACRIEKQPTGVQAEVVRDPCPCGRPDPRIVLT